MNESDIKDKIDELRDSYINNDGDLVDALIDCLDEMRALRNARNQDDKLNAVDELIDALNNNIRAESKLRDEAIELLANDEQETCSAMDDAGHKESDFR